MCCSVNDDVARHIVANITGCFERPPFQGPRNVRGWKVRTLLVIATMSEY